jgi:hypothetical protein
MIMWLISTARMPASGANDIAWFPVAFPAGHAKSSAASTGPVHRPIDPHSRFPESAHRHMVVAELPRAAPEAPEELTIIFAITRGLPVPFLPEEWHGQPVMATVTCWCGSPEWDEEITSTVAGLGEVLGQAHWRMPFPAINTLFDDLLPKGLQHYLKANVASEISEKALEVHMEHGPRVPNIESGPFFFPINGACHSVGENDTAFAHRNKAFSLVISGSWKDPADNDKKTAWVRDYYDALRPYSG